jgi:hypothetical protein
MQAVNKAIRKKRFMTNSVIIELLRRLESRPRLWSHPVCGARPGSFGALDIEGGAVLETTCAVNLRRIADFASATYPPLA